jgi:phytanoyl-CoA hydroxylase
MEPTALASQLRGDGQPGYVLRKGFVDPSVGEGMLEDVVGIARAAAGGESVAPAFVTKETQAGFDGRNPEDLVSKIFRLHHRDAFRKPLSDPRVLAILNDAIGPDVDCFLSQFIFKNPGAWGQPWHQDSFYFPFEPARPIVGLWLAVTKATLENGCLHILPGSQNEPVHEHVADERPNSPFGYVEIVDHDTSASLPCLLDPGDLLIFDSHLMHRSTDNRSQGLRAAMVWHFAAAGTVDEGTDLGGGKRFFNPAHRWLPVMRGGAAA